MSTKRRRISGGLIKTDFLTPELVLQLNAHFQGDTPLQVYLPFPSLSSFLRFLGISPIIPHPFDHFSRPQIALARFHRWNETLNALGQPDPELRRNLWPRFGGFLSCYSLHPRPSKTSIGLNLTCRKWVKETFKDSRTRSDLMVRKKDYDIDEVYNYLIIAARRSDAGDCPSEDTSVLANGPKMGGKGKPVISDAIIGYTDVEKIVRVINEVIDKIDEYTSKGRIALELLKTAGLDDEEVASIIRKRRADVVVMDLYRRKEIKYGWHWLRDWFPLWCVHKWDGDWLKERLDGITIETEGTTTAAKKLQKICRDRCHVKFAAIKMEQSIRKKVWVWNDFEKMEFYYV